MLNLFKKKTVPCKKCGAELAEKALKDNLYICPECNTYLRMGAYERLELVCDKGTFDEKDSQLSSLNHIDFPGYEDKLADAKSKSGISEAVICGVGEINGAKTALFAMDSNFMMGSMGSVVGERLTRLFELATEQGLPVVGFTTSGGARMQEGIFSLMQMAKVSGAVKKHSDAGNLYITVLTDPTTGGVTASFAMLGDIIIAEPKALVGFAGARVIEQTTGKALPAGFQRAEFLLEHGFVDVIAERGNLKATLGNILKIHSCKVGGNI